ncbi:DUF3326 domain-containing protein [Marimonas lutisalis]|uniref:DUF3326 domain-containing protein n=1 Tax=Marimonas lutisalis TaxID=2545756 RepID=UPI001375B68F|nr:DUF3326 domain-containing protein [Marimonas lutisalis]
MKIHEKDIRIPALCASDDPLAAATDSVADALGPNCIANRFVVTKSDPDFCHCEVGLIEDASDAQREKLGSIFDFRQRGPENRSSFNAAFLVPTGIGSTIGGHAGDATPAARVIATLCDRVLLHPNVVNASDLNEMPENALYVEGSVLSRLFMGTIGLQPVRANRVLTVMDNHPEPQLRDSTINTVNAARAVFGLTTGPTVLLDPPVRLSATYTASGRASGMVEGVDHLCRLLEERAGTYDAVAFATMIDLPVQYHTEYFESDGEMINPWGGVEAIFTHAVSSLFDVPTAHAPIDESLEIARMSVGQVDPRMAAEAISLTYFQCVLKGLRQSPRIVHPTAQGWPKDAITAEDISCLVIPDKCIGLPTLAALKQGITVIAVRENENILENDLTHMPWAPGQFFQVDNYWEAAGVIAALRQGLDPYSARRPFAKAALEVYGQK